MTEALATEQRLSDLRTAHIFLADIMARLDSGPGGGGIKHYSLAHSLVPEGTPVPEACVRCQVEDAIAKLRTALAQL